MHEKDWEKIKKKLSEDDIINTNGIFVEIKEIQIKMNIENKK